MTSKILADGLGVMKLAAYLSWVTVKSSLTLDSRLIYICIYTQGAIYEYSNPYCSTSSRVYNNGRDNTK